MFAVEFTLSKVDLTDTDRFHCVYMEQMQLFDIDNTIFFTIGLG